MRFASYFGGRHGGPYSLFLPEPESDMVGDDHQVLREAEGAAFSTIEEDVGGDGGD